MAVTILFLWFQLKQIITNSPAPASMEFGANVTGGYSLLAKVEF